MLMKRCSIQRRAKLVLFFKALLNWRRGIDNVLLPIEILKLGEEEIP